jgi:hypothetical protein
LASHFSDKLSSQFDWIIANINGSNTLAALGDDMLMKLPGGELHHTFYRPPPSLLLEGIYDCRTDC